MSALTAALSTTDARPLVSGHDAAIINDSFIEPTRQRKHLRECTPGKVNIWQNRSQSVGWTKSSALASPRGHRGRTILPTRLCLTARCPPYGAQHNSFSRRAGARALFDSSPPPNRGEAERRQAQPSIVRAAHKCCHLNALRARKRAPSGARSPLGAPPRLSLRRPNATAQPRAALPGNHRMRTGFWPSPMPAQRAPRPPPYPPPQAGEGRVGAAARAGSRSRPGAGLRVPPAGAALAPQSGSHPDAPVDERDSRLVAEMVTDVKRNVTTIVTTSKVAAGIKRGKP